MHNPDGAVGGLHSDIQKTAQDFSLGNKSVNRSIGPLWSKKGRANSISKWAEQLPPGTKMNVRLRICPE